MLRPGAASASGWPEAGTIGGLEDGMDDCRQVRMGESGRSDVDIGEGGWQ